MASLYREGHPDTGSETADSAVQHDCANEDSRQGKASDHRNQPECAKAEARGYDTGNSSRRQALPPIGIKRRAVELQPNHQTGAEYRAQAA